MSTTVLFLDHQFRPLRVEAWQRAITDLFLGKVEVVAYSRDRMIRGVTRDHRMPSVVRVLRIFKRDKQRVRFSRLNIYLRDNFTCSYCGQRHMTEDLTFDHVMPRSQGGRTSWENIVTCCVPCNAAKANRTPEQARMKLRRRPLKPTYLPVVTVQMPRRQVPEEWLPYWNASLEG